MKIDKKFLRLCCVCRKYHKKEELVRITRDYKTNNFVVNINNSYQGRSIYVCSQSECIQKFLKNKKNLNLLNEKVIEELNRVSM